MTADPGAYDVSLDDLRTVEAERHGDAARDDTADGMVRLAAAGIDAFFGAVTPRVMPEREYLGLPPRVPPAVAEHAVVELGRWRPAIDALVALDVACDSGLSRWEPEFDRMWDVLMDRLHRARGTWPMGGAA